jgi:hypothetical protein
MDNSLEGETGDGAGAGDASATNKVGREHGSKKARELWNWLVTTALPESTPYEAFLGSKPDLSMLCI